MSTEQPPPHALYVQWGKFKAGAAGIPAIVTIALIAAAIFVWRVLSGGTP